ncbi:MAG TPA: hypothetical protein DEA55_02185 [Rhodospirillaceae bacterium]|nr:hypothetical protein [Rhodospirillaceae bacterium]
MSNLHINGTERHLNILAPIFLMCRPDYYDPRIEKHQKPGHPAPNRFISGNDFDPGLAVDQWNALKEKLESLGAQVILVDPVEGLVDQVFTADSSVSLMTLPPDNANAVKAPPIFHTLYSRFKHAARTPELQAQMCALESLKSDLEKTHLNGSRPTFMLGRNIQNFEGGDNLYDPYRDMFWSGYGDDENIDTCRSSIGSHGLLKEFMEVKVQGIEVANGFYHLDTSLAPLPGGHMICYPGGMNRKSFESVQKAAENETIILVHEEDAQKFGCNVITVDRHNIVMPLCSDNLRREIESHDYAVHMVDVGEFIKSGGGPHCLTNRVNQPRTPGGLRKFPNFYDMLRYQR